MAKIQVVSVRCVPSSSEVRHHPDRKHIRISSEPRQNVTGPGRIYTRMNINVTVWIDIDPHYIPTCFL